MTNSAATGVRPPHLKRALRLWHIVIYGIIIIQPTAPMAVYGVVNNVARGHVVTTILIAMVAMLFTASATATWRACIPAQGRPLHTSAKPYIQRWAPW